MSGCVLSSGVDSEEEEEEEEGHNNADRLVTTVGDLACGRRSWRRSLLIKNSVVCVCYVCVSAV